jgi:hypothetical protein
MPATGKGASGAGKAGKSKAAPAKRPKPIVEQKAALIDIAELLQGVALESCGRHHRYSALVKRGAAVSEQKAALAAVRECDEILDEAVDLYQLVCLEETNHADDAWWHKANMVWRAAKEYLRHNVASRRSTRFDNGHSRYHLRELSIEYELEASALLHLRHATDSYKAVRAGA